MPCKDAILKAKVKSKAAKKRGRPKIDGELRKTNFKTVRTSSELAKALDKCESKSEVVLKAIEELDGRFRSPKGRQRCPFCRGSGFEVMGKDSASKDAAISYRASTKVYGILESEKNQSEYTTLALYAYFIRNGKIAGTKCAPCKGGGTIGKFTAE